DAFLDPDDVPYLPRLQISSPRAGVSVKAGDVLRVSCFGRPSSMEYEVYLLNSVWGMHKKQRILLGSFPTDDGPMMVDTPRNIRPGDRYQILVISGPLTALSENFSVTHKRRR